MHNYVILSGLIRNVLVNHVCTPVKECLSWDHNRYVLIAHATDNSACTIN